MSDHKERKAVCISRLTADQMSVLLLLSFKSRQNTESERERRGGSFPAYSHLVAD